MNETNIDYQVVSTIINKYRVSDSGLVVLNFKQGGFYQDIRKDTLTLIINGFVFGHIINPSDSSIFSNIDTVSNSFFKFQGLWNNESIKSHSLELTYLKKVDSIPGIKDFDYKNVYSFNWVKIPISIRGFTTFSKPIINLKNEGFIAQMIYTSVMSIIV